MLHVARYQGIPGKSIGFVPLGHKVEQLVGFLDGARDSVEAKELGREACIVAEEGRGDEGVEEGDVADGGVELETGF